MSDLQIVRLENTDISSWDFSVLRAELQRGLDSYAGLVYTDETIKDAKNDRSTLNKVKKVIDGLNGDTFGLSTEDIANMAGLTPEMVATVFATETNILSMSTPISFDGNNNTNESTLADTIDGGDRADKNLVEEDKNKEIQLYLSILTSRERKIVCMKFGIGEEYEKNDKDIAETLKITIYTVNRLFDSAMRKLREAAANK